MISSGDEYCDAQMPASPETELTEEGESPFGRRVEMFRQMYSIDHSLPSGPDSQPSSAEVCPIKILFMVLHGGNILEASQGPSSKRSDFAMLQATFDSVIQSHYHSAASHVAFRLVHCPQVCSDTLNLLSSLSPFSYDSQASADGNIAATQDFVPLGAIALFATSSADYQEYVNAAVCRANTAYHEFLNSAEGRGFTGQTCVLADSTGSMLTYDALTRMHSPFLRGGSHCGSHESVDEFHDETLKPASPKILESESPNLSHSDPDLLDNEQPQTVERRPRTERSRSEVSPPKSGDWARTDSLRFPSFRNSGRLSASCSDRGPSRRTSSGSNFDGGYAQFDFDVSDFFMFGSPLALVLAYRRVFAGEDRSCPPLRPACHQVYNMFHSSDPLAVRVEPLMNDSFKYLSPVNVARYSKFPLGDGEPVHVVEAIQTNLKLFTDCPRSSTSPGHPVLQRQLSNSSMTSVTSGLGENTVSAITNVTSRWWGSKRMDYVLYCPDALHSFPTSALAPLFHSSFWESTDAVAFILRQVLRHDVTVEEGAERGVTRTASFKMTKPREKWLRRRTTIKVRNLQQNHRANDVIVLEDKDQTLVARFMYGSLDIVSLTGEKVDVNVMTQPPSGDWVHLGTATTDSHGKLVYTLTDDQRLNNGMYPVKCIVRGDHTSVDFFLTVLPPKTETVVFSIDGSFTASVSIMGKDPKVRAGAVDVVRHWQDLGYLILYVSARPDMQHRKVVAWLAQHNFPHGMVSFMDGLSKDPLRQKYNYLKQLQTEADVRYVAAYGSSKDVTIYKELGLQASQIFIVGKASRKLCSQAQVIADGYAAHLNNLMDPGALRPATGNARMFLRKSCFRLPSNTESKKTAKRTVSYPGTAGKGAEFLRLPDTAPGPTKIIVPDVPIGEEDGFGGAARARGKSPTVQKNTGTRTTTV
ncbi:protein retinal degeneration B-like [Littorina saxatilis]